MSEDQSGVVTLKVRVTPEFREKIVETAKANNRSMNQEIVHRLEQSFSEQNHPMVVAETIINDVEQKRVANDPRERRRLAKIAAESALKDMPAKEFMEMIFEQLNKGGMALTIEEVNRTSSSAKNRVDVDHKLPKSKKDEE